MNQEFCSAENSSPSDIKAVGRIMMQLLQKYVKEGGAIGIENLNRCSLDSNAVKFLSMTTSASSLEELTKIKHNSHFLDTI